MKNNEKEQSKENNFQFVINAQYLKDFSFESPKAPKSLRSFNEKPDIKIDVDLNTQPLKDHGEDVFEVSLTLKGTTNLNKECVFLVEGTYSGIFTIKNAPEDILKKILLIECPKFLFPFLRTIIGNCTRDGGFPPLMITPIDFVALFESKNKTNS